MSGIRPTMGHMTPGTRRAEEWMRIFGTLDVPLLSAVTVKDSTGADFYRLNVKELTQLQRDRLIRHMVFKTGRPIEKVIADLDNPDIGMPVLADDITVTFDARLLL